MRFFKIYILVIILSVTFLDCPYAALETESFAGIKNAVLLEEDILGGGPPSDEDISQAKKVGIKTIIDLRSPQEGTGEEESLVKSYGLNYYNIPVTPDTFNMTQADQLAEILSHPENRPAIIHCASGNRVGGTWAVYLHKYKALNADEAFEEGLNKGLKSQSMQDAVKEVLGLSLKP